MNSSALSTTDWLDVVIHQVLRDGDDTLIIELESANGLALPPYEPGAHVAVACGPTVVRHYSLCGIAQRPSRYRLGVKIMKDGRGGSAWIAQQALTGSRLHISGPRNNFPLDTSQTNYLFLSGGIGITPILSMLSRLREHGKRARLVHMCRSENHLAFAEDLRDLGRFHDVHIHFDSVAGSLYDLTAELRDIQRDTAVYCCGPAPMMNFVRDYAQTHDIADRFHFEFFAGEVAAMDTPFTVVLQHSDREVHVPSGQSMLTALRQAGLSIESGCEEGACGACMLRLISGTPDHRDVYLTEAERATHQSIIPCVSRCSEGPLVVDL